MTRKSSGRVEWHSDEAKSDFDKAVDDRLNLDVELEKYRADGFYTGPAGPTGVSGLSIFEDQKPSKSSASSEKNDTTTSNTLNHKS